VLSAETNRGLRGHSSAIDFYGSFTYILPYKDRGILVLSFRQKAGRTMGCPKLMQEYYNECNWSANISEGATNFLSRLTQATDSNEGQLDSVIDRQYDKIL